MRSRATQRRGYRLRRDGNAYSACLPRRLYSFSCVAMVRTTRKEHFCVSRFKKSAHQIQSKLFPDPPKRPSAFFAAIFFLLSLLLVSRLPVPLAGIHAVQLRPTNASSVSAPEGRAFNALDAGLDSRCRASHSHPQSSLTVAEAVVDMLRWT